LAGCTSSATNFSLFFLSSKKKNRKAILRASLNEF